MSHAAPEDHQILRPSEWVRFIQQLDLPPMTKLVGIMLAQYADFTTGRDAHPGEARLAADCSLRVRACRNHLASLRALGLITRTRRTGAPGIADEYRLTIPADPSTLPRTVGHPALD